MNGRQRFEAALRLEEADHVPVAPIFQGYWALERHHVTVPDTLIQPQLAVEALLRAQDECPFDALEVVWDWVAPVDAVGCESRITPTSSPLVTKPAVRQIEDIESLRPVDLSNDARVQASVESARLLVEALGDETFCYATIAQPFTFANQMRRADALMLDIMKRPEAVHALVAYATEVVIQQAREYARVGVHGIFACDGAASGDLLSPKHYREFVAPYTARLNEAAREMGIAHIQHVCGNTTGNLETVREIGPSAYSFDYTTDVAVAKEKVGDAVCLIGNIDPSEILLFGDADQVQRVTEECLAKGAPDGGFIVGSGCDICLGTPLENLRAMVAACQAATY